MIRTTIVTLLLFVQFVCASPPIDGPVAGLWVTRWDYRDPHDVTKAMRDAQELGVTDVFWQVRGQADAFYKSDLEPWGQELLDDGETDPGYDPLTLAVREAHARGMRLHAWINVFPLWKGAEPPKNPDHPWHAHPEWRLYGRDGAHQPLNEHYVIFNPASEAVHAHIEAVARDIASRYDIDGLHLDYVRFVSDTMDDDAFYPADPATLAFYADMTGVESVQTEAEIAAYRDWIRTRISTQVQRIADAVRTARPGTLMTAAVWRRPELARQTYLQDAAEWTRRGSVDYVSPMIYRVEDEDFADDVAAWRAAVEPAKLVPGIGIYKHAPGKSGPQLAEGGDNGFVLFAYAALFESADPNQDTSDEAVAERAARRDGIAESMNRE